VRVLVDTSIWSLALRRSRAQISNAEKRMTSDLRDFIQDGRARLIGAIRQELLSGVRDPDQFEQLKTYLRAFPDEPVSTDDYEAAARWSNQCRSRGITGSETDFLICAVSIARGWLIFTLDNDFQSYARVIPLKLYPTAGARHR
jgi:predicted nucleic acid-binding protein